MKYLLILFVVAHRLIWHVKFARFCRITNGILGSQVMVEVFLDVGEVWVAATPEAYTKKGNCGTTPATVVVLSRYIAAVQRLATYGCSGHASRLRPWMCRARRRSVRPHSVLKPEADDSWWALRKR